LYFCVLLRDECRRSVDEKDSILPFGDGFYRWGAVGLRKAIAPKRCEPYRADGRKAEAMAAEAERFRVVTMKVLTMQLNSVTVMDIIAYSGAAMGIIFALTGYGAGASGFCGVFVMIMLAAEFFLPLRALGSYFHAAMNGVAASDRLFRILDMEEPERGGIEIGQKHDMMLEGLRFAYDEGREILRDITMEFPQGGFVSIVGESGSGKSTIASILSGRSRKYRGNATVGGVELSEIDEASLMKNVTYIDHNSYLFKGTVEENLRLAKPDASEQALWRALGRVKLSGFLIAQAGLQTSVAENGANLSGGQRQRLALGGGLCTTARCIYLMKRHPTSMLRARTTLRR
jgi:ABC-type transport system involved in cytochrome bd biosynthesis fused ATPase/permease subunit